MFFNVRFIEEIDISDDELSEIVDEEINLSNERRNNDDIQDFIDE